MLLPTGTTAVDFTAALTKFRQIVGSEWVMTTPEDLYLYRDAYSPLWNEPQERLASAAVAPKSTEEVQAVVRAANEYRIPIHAISTGKNLGYGGSAPTYSGSVVLDLRRMNRILEVNEQQAYCLVEPGVSYFDFYRYVREHNIRLWMDVPDPGWGSMLGNALDRGAGYTTARFRNHFDAHCGMEIVLADGEILRTGMGAMPGAQTWQMYKSGFGPWVDGIFSQSNFGVVTKMGFWLMPEPQAYLKGVVHLPRYEDIVPLVDTLTHLENTNVVSGYPDLLSPALGTPGLAGTHRFLVEGPPSHNPEYYALAARGAAPQEYEPYARRNGIPFWSLKLPFYGPEKIIRAHWEHVQERFRAVSAAARFEEQEFVRFPLTDAQLEQLEYPALVGVPSLSAFQLGARAPWNHWPPSDGHVWFSPILPRSGQAILEVNAVLGPVLRQIGATFSYAMNLPLSVWERCFTLVIGLPVSKDPAVNQKMRAGFRRLVQVAAEHGWGEYRTPVAFQDDVMRTYSFNDHALLRFHERLKDAVDPNGILSPGRYGIWPKHLRGGP